ncbi:hypothetical protein ACFCW2_04180 [Qipengyuania sp. DSG2-2]|uniref:hypothetical protein n=1 Tax=Qipengyuania sp. DGS2-2 TaxID=3349631 RepID=UPI0036D21E57
MIFHYLAAALLIFAIVQHAALGYFARFLRRHSQIDHAGKIEAQDPSAVLAISIVVGLWAGMVALLIVPGIPAVIEVGLGILIICATLAATIKRGAPTMRPYLLLLSGALILAGNLI